MEYIINPKVIIVTISYNTPNYTIKSIKSIFKSDYKNFKILLIDNASIEDNFNKLRKNLPKDERLILILQNKNLGYVNGVNFGLEESLKFKPDYFMIMNNDTLIDPKALGYLVDTCRKYKDKAIVMGKVYDYGTNIIQYIGDELIDKRFLKYNRIGAGESDSGQFDQISVRDMIDDIFWLFPKKLYDEIGGYSEYFWFNGESSDFALRAKKKGYKLVFTPDAKLWHKGSITIGGRDRNPAKAYWIMQSNLICRYLHVKRRYFIFYLYGKIYEILATLIKSLYIFVKFKKNDFSYPKAKLLGMLSLYKIIKNNTNNGHNPFI